MSKYFVYYESPKSHYRYYDGNSYKSTTNRAEIKSGFFEMHPSYENTDEDLKRYYDKLPEWSEQIRSKFTKCNFDYLSKFNDMIAVEHFFLLFCKKSISTHDDVTFTEQSWIEKCKNSGLQSCKPTDKPIKVYSYDGKGFYQMILASDEFMIPDKEGYEATLDKLPKRKELKHGYYHVKITSDNPDARMVFSFNPDHVYYYYDLYFAMKHKKELDFNIELYQDNEPNCYLYDSVVPSSTIFAKWNKTINELKKEFPSNKLLKNLGSKCHGVISKRCQITVNNKELQQNLEKYKDHDIIRTTKIGEWGTKYYDEYHVLQSPEKPYKHNIRLKAQITSYARSYIGNLALENIETLIRINTDSFSMTKPWKELNKKLFKREEKSSGIIQFYNCNKYMHECWKCKEQYKYKDFVHHKCW